MRTLMRSFGLLLAACLAAGCGGKSTTSPDAGGEPQECSTLQDDCGQGLECLCCGSIGPQAVCLCTQECASDADCDLAYLPSCNQPGPNTAGICTPEDYNCCWECQ